MPIEYKIEEVAYDLPVDEKNTIKVRFSGEGYHGTHLSTVYRGEVINGNTIAQVADLVAQAKRLAEQKADRAKVIKEMEKNPIPAWLQTHAGLKPVVVRGVVQGGANSQKDMLITVVKSGEKNRVGSASLLRELTAEELAEYRAAMQAITAAQDAIPSAIRQSSAAAGIDAVVTIRHDAVTDEQVALVNGEEIREQRSYDLKRAAETHLISKVYPWTLTNDGVPALLACTEAYQINSLFKTLEDAQACADAKAALTAAHQAANAVIDRFRFDTSVFRDESDKD